MFVEERQSRIIEILRQDGKVSVDHLAMLFGVSAPTIRSDLAVLEDRRLLRRTHGGAIRLETTLYELPFSEREQAQQDEKRRIAKVAAERVSDNETILLDAGTTILEIARFICNRRGLTVVTNSIPAAYELSEANHNVVLVGGKFHPGRRATLGPLATEFLRDMHVDRAFIGVNGVSEDSGWTVVDFDAVQIKRAMMARAREVVVVADHSKLGETTFASIGPLNAAHVLITDTPIGSMSLGSALEKAGVQIVMSDDSTDRSILKIPPVAS
jgi:DeoR/GlpR family transcriptional regulator of sugar metabolism